MCTATWWQQPGFCRFYFNRDERKSRQNALPPQIQNINGTSFIAPQDADGGGTWISVNQHTVFLALLNYYAAELDYQPDNPVSRGRLVTLLSGSENLDSVEIQLQKLDLTPYRPFFLLAGSLHQKPGLWQWNGRQLRHLKAILPVTTSSFNSEEVVLCRKKEFQRRLASEGGLGPDLLERFHRWQNKEDTAFGVWMERPDARTMSQSVITLEKNRIRFSYIPLEQGPGSERIESVLELTR